LSGANFSLKLDARCAFFVEVTLQLCDLLLPIIAGPLAELQGFQQAFQLFVFLPLLPFNLFFSPQ
jgi:hypothetical protein